MYKNIGATGMLVAPIKSLAFDLRHQVFINTLRFTGFDNKMDTVIETAVKKSFISAFSSVNTFLRSFEFDDAAPHRRQQTDLIEYSTAIFDQSRCPVRFFLLHGRGKRKSGLGSEITFSMCRHYIVNTLRH